MKIVFGEKIDGVDYHKRKGVYAVIFNLKKDRVMTVVNERGHYFLPGGEIESDESHLKCLQREMLEETGYEILMGLFIGYAIRYFKSTKDEPLLNEGYFYLADLSDKVRSPIEEDHYIKWIDIKNSNHLLIHEHHFWAVKEGLGKT